MKKMMLFGLAVLMVLGIAAYVYAAAGSVTIANGGPHNMLAQTANLSVGASGEPCAFCHLPHNTYTGKNIPLSNRPGTGQGFCRSCHDGATAVSDPASLVRQPLSANLAGGYLTNATYVITLWTGLGDLTHPVDITYPDPTSATGIMDGLIASGTAITNLNALSGSRYAITDISGEPAGSLDTGKIECQSCHDAHNYASNTRPFLRGDNSGSGICTSCHSM